jgi:hypothetical protein
MVLSSLSHQNLTTFSSFSHDFAYPGALSFSHNSNGSATET